MDKLDETEYKEFFEFIRKASQIELYFLLDGLGQLRNVLHRAYAHDGTLDYQSFYDSTEEAFLKGQAAMKELSRFGINGLLEDDESPSQEYWNWYNRFDKYAKGLSKEQYTALEARINSQEDTTDVLP